MERLVELARKCVEIVGKYGCASLNLILHELANLQLVNPKSDRSDVMLVLRALVLAGVLEERKYLDTAHFFCLPGCNKLPPELEDVLNAIAALVNEAKSPLIGLSAHAVVKKMRNMARKVNIEPSSQLVVFVLEYLYRHAGVSKQTKRRGKVYIYTCADLAAAITRLLDGRVEPKQLIKQFRPIWITKELTQLAEKFKKLFT